VNVASRTARYGIKRTVKLPIRLKRNSRWPAPIREIHQALQYRGTVETDHDRPRTVGRSATMTRRRCFCRFPRFCQPETRSLPSYGSAPIVTSIRLPNDPVLATRHSPRVQGGSPSQPSHGLTTAVTNGIHTGEERNSPDLTEMNRIHSSLVPWTTLVILPFPTNAGFDRRPSRSTKSMRLSRKRSHLPP
jgi:hypothetical protein